ncbi:MAG: C39 family peptidase [Elusimicrobia bacterium]|nr:C39 family peptidase [Elusimicrobiota bacterium]
MHTAAALISLAFAAAPARAAMTFVHQTPLDVVEARAEGLVRLSFEKGLFQGTGSVESPVVEVPAPFDDLVGSWNAETPKGASVEMDAQVRQGGRWSKWFRLSRFSPGDSESFDRQEDGAGLVETDTLRLKEKADAFRWRVKLVSAGAREARLVRVAVALADRAEASPEPEAFAAGPWVRELKLAPRSQREEDPKVRGDICSPTALAMVLEFWGVTKTTPEVYQAVFDKTAGIYGNWPLNVAVAGAYGLSGHVARLPGLASLQALIAADRPVIVSIGFGEGELDGAPLKRTKGHLVVVVGFDEKGDVIVQDPAAPDRRGTRRVYRRAQFARAWLTSKMGLAYVLGPRLPFEAVVGVPTADLRAASRAPQHADAMDFRRLTQILYGERVRVLEAKGDWARVEVLDQPHPAPGGRWRGYEGWVRADQLRTPSGPFGPGLIVRAKRLEVRWRDAAGLEETLTLPIGARLAARSSSGAASKVVLLDGRVADAPTAALRPDSAAGPVDRREILEAAALFLGDVYVWGGRSSFQLKPGWGVDCSGLVHLAFLAAGRTVPRDADAQFLKAAPRRRSELKPGDLVFLTESARSKHVNHVLIYTGGDGLLESRESAGKALRTTFAERFGAALDKLEDGGTVTDLTKNRPFKRRIHFGSLLEAS